MDLARAGRGDWLTGFHVHSGVHGHSDFHAHAGFQVLSGAHAHPHCQQFHYTQTQLRIFRWMWETTSIEESVVMVWEAMR